MDFRAAFCGRSILWIMIALLLMGVEKSNAQESIRPSLAGELDAASRKPIIDTANYNIKLGPALVDLSASLDFEYTDNVALSDTNRRSDVIVEPNFNANVLWQLSEINALRLNLGIGYVKYLKNSQFDSTTLVIAPDSQVAFDIYVGDFKVTIFDRFSIQQNPVSEINLSNVAKFERLLNSAGLMVTWDLNWLILFGGYSHYNFHSLESQFDFLNQSEEQFFLSANLKLSDALTIGARGTFATANYSQTFQNNSLNYSAGTFVDTQVTRYLRLSAEAGYQGAHFDGGGQNGDSSQLNAPYGRLSFDHRVNRYWTQSLIFGHEAPLGFTTNYTALTYVRYSANWRVNSRATLNSRCLLRKGERFFRNL